MRHRRLAVALLAAATALAVCISSGSAAVNVAQSGWSWGNPTPQGNTLGAIDFVQGRGYAAGAAGTVLRTDDGGTTWTGLATGTSADLNRLQVLDPDTITVLGGNGCVLRRSDDAGATFHKIFIVAEQNCPAPVQAFTFVDKQTGYLLLQDGSVLRTTDAGQTFARQTAVPGTQASNNATGNKAVDIAFTGPDTGIVFVAPNGGGPSIAFATTDAGISWKPVDGVDPGSVRSIWLLDPTHGFAVGANTLLATSDAGKTWKAQPVGPGHDLTSIRCADAKTCVLTTAKGDVLLRTTDGGITATAITPSSQPIFAAAFASATRVAAVGASGATVVSDDGGVNYAPISRDIGGVYYALRAGPNASSAFALGRRGGLGATTDGGATWKTLAVPTSADLLDASFPTPDTGYALDVSGGLFKTSNSGTTWQTLDTGTTSAPSALAAPAADVVVLVGPKGIRRSAGSAQPQAVGGPAVAKARLTSVVARPRVLAAFGMSTKKVFLSSDRGVTWKAVKLPKKTVVGTTGGVDFLNSKLGFLLDSRKRLWKTADGGKAWIQLLGAGTSSGRFIAMASAREGFLSVDFFGLPANADPNATAYVMRTSDGGKTWRPQAIARGPMQSVVATGPFQGYALVGDNHLFVTRSGGDAGNLTRLTLKTPVSAVTAKALKKVKGRMTVTGSLPGAVGGEQIVVSRRDLRGGGWIHQIVTAGANSGSFTTSWKISRTSVFVAQWAGDSGRRGAGSTPLVLTVKPAPKKAKR
jgi:photosystem II stability/assembly factor-like uncharacterized protein